MTHRFLCTIVLTVVVSSRSSIPNYGFPRCYTSFEKYDEEFVDKRTNHETRPLVGAQRYPYTGGGDDDASQCTNEEVVVVGPLIALGPHWSPIGLTQYVRNNQDECRNCLPNTASSTLIVASHGSWNRRPYIGYKLQAYEVDTSTWPYQVLSQSTLLPPLRHADTGVRLRPVDVKNSPVDDALLMTADHDDLERAQEEDVEEGGGGGLYRIRGTTSTTSDDNNDDGSSSSVTPLDFATDLNALGENPGNVTLERLASIPCARQIAVSVVDPTIVYVSTLSNFCPVDQPGGGDAIWVLQLDATDSKVVKGPVPLIDNLNSPQGIDTTTTTATTTGSSTSDRIASTVLYVSTGGTLPTNRGGAILEIVDVDDYAYGALGISTDNDNVNNDVTYPIDGTRSTNIVSTLVQGFTVVQLQHSWRSLRVHPSRAFLIVSVGADCNWSETCTDNGRDNLQTTLVRIGLLPASVRGQVSVAARGVRNAMGFHFDDRDNLMFTSFGSDDARGIDLVADDDTSTNNLPDCTVEVLKFDETTVVTPIVPPSTGVVSYFFEILRSLWKVIGFILSYALGGIPVVD